MSPSVSMHDLKVRQDELSVRKDKLLECFTKFREGLITRINSFAAEAAEAELRGAAPCIEKRNTEDIFAVECSLNGHGVMLAFLKRVAVTKLPPRDDVVFASKAFLYQSKPELGPPPP